MACHVKVNRHGFLAFRLYWKGMESWEGTGLRDTVKNRRRVEARAEIINEEMEQGTFDYLKRFPEGNKSHLFKPEEEPTKEDTGPKTVGQYYEEWIKTKKPPMVRKSLEQKYRQHYENYIEGQSSDVSIEEITPRFLENFRIYLLEERGLKLKTCRNIIDGTFRAMIRDARVVDYLIDKDPFAALKWPRTENTEPDPFTEQERDKILLYFKMKNPFYYPFIYTQFWTGIRPSEATALKWGNIDLDRGTFSITRSRHLGEENATKTKGSWRTIRLLPNVDDLLKQSKPLRVTEGDYLFTNTEGGPLDQDQWRKDYWYKSLRALSIRERKFYATRHTYISVALSAGVNIKWLAEQCGSSVAMIEKHYGRYIRDDGDAPLRALLGGKTETFTETFLDYPSKLLKSVASPRGFEPLLPA